MDAYKAFFLEFLIAVTLLSAAIIAFNIYIDPLWYFGGNRFSGINYSFNGRESKLNLYLKSPGHYDCIVFGASAETLLDASLIKNHACFNFSFNAGNVLDFIDYAKYIKSLGAKPSLIVVGVDFYDFREKKLKSEAPDAVKNFTSPPSPLKLYFSWDALFLSYRTVRGDAPMPHNFDSNFKGIVLYDKIQPNWRETVDKGYTIFYNTSSPVTADNLKYYEELRQIFPQATYIGYVPHVSAKVMAKIKFAGQLDPLLDVIYRVSKLFDRFYDFSVPSKTTIDSPDTYDGYHFTPDITRQVAEEINGNTTGACLDLQRETFEEYKNEYNRRLDDYIESHHFSAASFPSDKENLGKK